MTFCLYFILNKWRYNDILTDNIRHYPTMTDYSQGRIYKIVNIITDDVYVGSTCQSLTKRLHEHKTIGKHKYENNRFYCKMEELGFDNFYIELIENYPCSTREELRAREGEWIRKISTLNKLVAGRDSKGYYIDNAEQLKQKSKDYRAGHKEQIKEYMAVYREAKKEEIKEQRKAHYEQNREAHLERKQQYHATHKQQERDYAKKRYEEDGKLQIECECGCVVTKCNLTRHRKTKVHTEFIKQKDNPQE